MKPPRKLTGWRAWEVPLWQLFLQNWYSIARTGWSMVFTLGVPALLALVLSLAFGASNAAPIRPTVAVASGPGDEAMLERLRTEPNLRVLRLDEPDARARLASGELGMVVVPTPRPLLVYDQDNGQGQVTRLLVGATLARPAGPFVAPFDEQQAATRAGPRFIEFLIPGLIAFSIFGGAMGLPASLVWMRSGKLLKRLVASPMRRHHFLLSYVLSRGLMVMILTVWLLSFARVAFDVKVVGSLASLLLFALVGALSLLSLGLLIGSRSERPENIGGLGGLINLVLMVGAGIFFPLENFPAAIRPALEFLPLSPLADGLRKIMLDGATLGELWRQIAILTGQGAIYFALAMKIFRWS